jgi:hypothetical protein
MNEHSFKVLEYHELLALIAGYTQSQLGADIVQNIRPHTQLNAIQSRRNLYGDLLGMAETSLSLPPLRIDDISQILREVAPDGAVVAGVDLNASTHFQWRLTTGVFVSTTTTSGFASASRRSNSSGVHSSAMPSSQTASCPALFAIVAAVAGTTGKM